MSNIGRGYDINQTFVIEPAGDSVPIISACTSVYSNALLSCSGNTSILLGGGVISFIGDLYTNDDLSANTINASTFYSGGTNLLNIISLNNITGGTFSNTTDTLTLYKGNGNVIVTGFTDYYTTGATLIGDTVYFNRNDQLSAYTVNLSSLVVSDIYVTAMTFNNNVLTLKQTQGTAPISQLIDNLSGLTVTGNVYTNTISATTYQNLPLDIYVTGGTYNPSTGVLVLTKNNVVDGYSITGFTTQFTGGTVTGATNFTAGLTANTISATTYYNLPVSGLTAGNNISITGSNGNYTIAFTGTTGSNFTGGTVTGATQFTNGLTANTISATTYQNLPISGLTAGSNISITGSNGNYTIIFTGGTVTNPTNFTNGVTANTISATTYQNLPISGLTAGANISITGSNGNYTIIFTGTTGSNFTGGTVSGATNFTGGVTANTLTVNGVRITGDTFTTAGTYNSSTSIITFTKNDGTNYTVSGLTGVTTAFTHSSNVLTISRSNASNLTATINTLTGLTINGNLTVTGSSTMGATTSSSLTVNNLTGTTDRMVQVNSTGNVTATVDIITAFLFSGSTAATTLSNGSNWDVYGAYIGSAITGTYMGQKHYDDNYYYEAVADNVFIRLIRG